jgi:hypothetical protein
MAKCNLKERTSKLIADLNYHGGVENIPPHVREALSIAISGKVGFDNIFDSTDFINKENMLNFGMTKSEQIHVFKSAINNKATGSSVSKAQQYRLFKAAEAISKRTDMNKVLLDAFNNNLHKNTSYDISHYAMKESVIDEDISITEDGEIVSDEETLVDEDVVLDDDIVDDRYNEALIDELTEEEQNKERIINGNNKVSVKELLSLSNAELFKLVSKLTFKTDKSRENLEKRITLDRTDKKFLAAMGKIRDTLNPTRTDPIIKRSSPNTKYSDDTSSNNSNGTPRFETLDADGIYNKLDEFVLEDFKDGRFGIDEAYRDEIMDTIETIADFYIDVTDNIAMDLSVTDVSNHYTSGTFTSGDQSTVAKGEQRIEIFSNNNDVSASKTEIFLHENIHAFAKMAFELNPKAFNSIKLLRDALVTSGDITNEVFLQRFYANNIEPTLEDINMSKRKFDYIFNKDADIEEFLAYALSNVDLMNHLKGLDKDLLALDKDSKLEANKGYFSAVKELWDSIKRFVGEIINGTNFNAKSMDIVRDAMKSIEDTHRNGTKSSEEFDMFSLPRTLLREKISTYPRTVKTVEVLYSAFNKIGYKPFDKTIKYLFKHLSKLAKYSIKQGKKGLRSKVASLLGSLPLIQGILESRLFKDIVRKLTTDTENGKFNKAYEHFRKVKLVSDKYINDIRLSLEQTLLSGEMGKIENNTKMQLVTKSIFNSGVSKHFKEFKSFKREDLIAMRNEYSFRAGSEARTSVKALVNYLHNGEVSEDLKYDNAYSILGIDEKYMKDNKSELNVIESRVKHVEMIVAIDTLLKNGTKTLNDLDSIMFSKSDSNLSYEIRDLIRSHEESANRARSVNRFMRIGYMNKNTDSRTTIGYIPSSDLKNGKLPLGVKFMNTEKLSKFSVDGETFYRVIFSNSNIHYNNGMFNSVSTSDTNGVSITDIYKLKLKRDNPNIKDSEITEKVRKLIKSYTDHSDFKSRNRIKNKGAIMPSINSSGTIVELYIPTSDSEFLSMNEGSMDFHKVLPSTQSRFNDVAHAQSLNTKTVKLLRDAYKHKNTKYKDEKFIKISPTSNTELWNMLSVEIKEIIAPDRKTQIDEIFERYTNGENIDTKNLEQYITKREIYVPDSLLELVFGTKRGSFSNVNINSLTLGLIKNKESLIGKETTRRSIIYLENLVAEFLGEIKSKTILFNSVVFIGNMISNMNIAWSFGVNPLEYMTRFATDWRALDEYTRMTSSLTKLKISDTHPSIIDDLEKKIENSKFAHLVKDGQLTPMVDDLASDTGSLANQWINERFSYDKETYLDKETERRISIEAYNRIEDSSDILSDHSAMEKIVRQEFKERGVLPSAIGGRSRDVIRFMYGAEGTSTHKQATKMVLYGDVLTKQMIIDKFNEKKDRTEKTSLNGFTDMDKLLSSLDMQFINYSYNDSSSLDWIEKVAGVHYLKYYLGHAKGYLKTAQGNATNVVGQQVGQSAIGIDISDPTDVHLNHTIMENVYNRWELANPIEAIGDLLMPNITKSII